MGFQWSARMRSLIAWVEPEMSSESANDGVDSVGGQDEDVARSAPRASRLSPAAARARERRCRAASEPFGRVADGSPLSTRPSTLPTPSQVIPRVGGGDEGQADGRPARAAQCDVAALDEQHEVRLGARAHDLGGPAGGAGGLGAVPEAVDPGHEHALRQER